MDMRKAFPSKYLKAADLDGRNITVTMLGIKMEQVGQDREEQKPVLYFDGAEKGLVLNKTNSDRIAEEFGWETNEWKGHKIILYSTEVDFQGKTVDAIRVRIPKVKDKVQPVASKPAPSDDEPPAHGDDEIPF
jgi:hypothetical protein